MIKFFQTQAILLCIFVLLACLGCTESSELETRSLTGTYSGLTSDGDPIVLTVEQNDQGFRGNGTLKGFPVVISGILTWEAIGSLTHADGSSSLVRITLSSDNGELNIKTAGQPDVDLILGGTPVTGSSGPFTGKYRTASPNDSLASATIVQTGTLLSGVGRFFDQITAISGQVTDPKEAKGMLTFLDESRVQFNAELSADQQSITITGMGNPVLLERF
jgi:hypothetical protein